MKILKRESPGTNSEKTIYKSLWTNHSSSLPRLNEILTELIGGTKSNIKDWEKVMPKQGDLPYKGDTIVGHDLPALRQASDF